MNLDPGQVKVALEGFDGLGGWQVENGALVRGVLVSHDSRQAFIEAVAAAGVLVPKGGWPAAPLPQRQAPG